MITIEQYWMGRDAKYPAELTAEIRHNAELLVGKVNNLLNFAEEDGVAPGVDQVTGNAVASGWRPHAVNDRTKNAASGSKHLTGQGVDLQDTPRRDLARWCLKNPDALEAAGLWMEAPKYTPSWVHLQGVPPKSGRRFYIPSSAPALVAELLEERGLYA